MNLIEYIYLRYTFFFDVKGFWNTSKLGKILALLMDTILFTQHASIFYLTFMTNKYFRNILLNRTNDSKEIVLVSKRQNSDYFFG